MIAALTIEDHSSSSLWSKIKALFYPYEITARLRKQNKITVLYVKYSDYRGKIYWKKLYPYLSGYHQYVLCPKSIDLSGTSLRRFEDNEYNLLLMRNFVTDMLQKADIPPQNLRIAYYDPMAACPSVAEALIDYTSRLTVVTDMPKFYENEAERLLELFGVPITVSNSLDALSNNDILLTSVPVTSPLPLSAHTIVFSAEPPRTAVRSTVIYDYFVSVPYKYQRLQPQDIGNAYFLSALYSLCRVRELEKILPVKCSDGQALFTAERLIQRLQSFRQSA